MALIDNLVSYYKLDESSGNAADSVGSNTLTNYGIDPALVSYWKLDGNSTDSVGSNTGTDTNATYSSGNGKIVQGVGFAGTGKIQYGAKIIPKGVKSVSMWAKWTNHADYMEWVDQAAGSGANHGFHFETGTTGDNDGIMSAQVAKGTGNLILLSDVSAKNDGNWHHYVFTWDGTTGANKAILYRDGSSVATGTATQTETVDPTYNLTIGSGANSSGLGVTGAIDEVGVWNRELTSSEVTSLYNSGSGLPFSSFPVYGATYSTGKINNGAVFNSPTQVLKIADASQTGLDFSGDFSFSLWYKTAAQPANGVWDYLIVKWLEGSSQRSYIWHYYNNAGTMVLNGAISVDGASDNRIFGVNQTLSNNTWYHLVWTWASATGKSNYYVNGSALGEESVTAATAFNSSADFQIGEDLEVKNAGVNHMIDEVGAWSRVLTSGEVTSLYNGGSGLQYPFGGAAVTLPYRSLTGVGI